MSRLYRGAVSLFIAASLVACSAGTQSIAPLSGRKDTGQAKGHRHTMSWNVGMTQPVATGVLIAPLTLGVNGTTGQVALFGTTDCAPPSGANPCPNINFTASPPQYYSSLDVPMTLSSATLSTSCTTPVGAATPAPGFAAACYVVTYEGGAGPYVLQGPLISSGSSLSVPAQNSTVYFQGLTPYNVFLEYVTAVSSPPPALTPSPVPSPTDFATPTPVASATASPSPCATAPDDDHRDDLRAMDDDEGTCSSPTPKPTPTSCDDEGDGHGHHHKHHRRHHARHSDKDDCTES